jgi:hypothetical protein
MTELDVYRPPRAEVAVPDHQDTDSWITVVRDIIKIADVIFDTPFVPDGLRGSAPAVAAAMLAGREMGLGIMTSLANIDVIKGKPTQKALLMRAMIQSKGHKWADGDVTDTRAVVRGCRKGESEWTEVAFTADQAKKAGIDLGKYPADKLYARATTRLARRKFADVIMGMPYSSEEIEDGDVRDDGDVPAAVDTSTGEVKTTPARTARRRQAATDASPAPVVTTPDAGAVAPSAERAGEAALPPLPGEEESSGPAAAPDTTDYDTPGTATRGKGGQLTALWTVLSTEFGFANTDAEKTLARTVCEFIINRDLVGNTTGNLSYNEAKTVLDTLAHWLSQAAKAAQHPRTYMTALMTAQDGEVPGE